ncbi:uncharacterized protein LOC134600832 [Pelobates fuscus]|uniref:uncharacterized protein LOC134600832 n=1 Tax=Pelobates fuscus TaxID=191477 RepID=UPI002FE45812
MKLFLSFTILCCVWICYSDLRPENNNAWQENIWLQIAKVFNLTSFCLNPLLSTENAIESYLIAVPTPISLLRKYLHTHRPHKSLQLYSYAFNPLVGKPPLALKTINVTGAELCWSFSCSCSRDPNTESLFCPTWWENTTNCRALSTTMNCTQTHQVMSYYYNVYLPKGWTFFCGNITYAYVPGNITGGPCAISRLTMTMFSKSDLITKTTQLHKLLRDRRDVKNTLTADCNPEITLLSKVKYSALAYTLVEVPGLALYNTRVVNAVACSLAKGLNATSQALEELLMDNQANKKAILENRAAIDYLLMKHDLGCEVYVLF